LIINKNIFLVLLVFLVFKAFCAAGWMLKPTKNQKLGTEN